MGAWEGGEFIAVVPTAKYPKYPKYPGLGRRTLRLERQKTKTEGKPGWRGSWGRPGLPQPVFIYDVFFASIVFFPCV